MNERRQAIPEDTTTTLYQLRLAHAVKQVDFFQVLELVRQNEKARRLVSNIPQEDWRALTGRIKAKKAVSLSYG